MRWQESNNNKIHCWIWLFLPPPPTLSGAYLRQKATASQILATVSSSLPGVFRTLSVRNIWNFRVQDKSGYSKSKGEFQFLFSSLPLPLPLKGPHTLPRRPTALSDHSVASCLTHSAEKLHWNTSLPRAAYSTVACMFCTCVRCNKQVVLVLWVVKRGLCTQLSLL